MKLLAGSLLLTTLFVTPLLTQGSAQNPPSLIARPDNLDELYGTLEKMPWEKSNKAEVLPLCDQILARDVVADFLRAGTDPAREVMLRLRYFGELAARIELWKEELEENPKSERLNYLLWIALAQSQPDPVNGGQPNLYPPVRVRISRHGSQFTGEILERGRWTELKSATIPMPRKALIGLVGNATTGTFKTPTLIAGEIPVADPKWQRVQIGRTSITGRLESSGDTLELTGAGSKPGWRAADDHFFAFQEMEGDGSLEVVIEEIGANNTYGAVGIMIRGSLDPSAPFASMTLTREEMTLYFWTRQEQAEFPGYLAALSGLRPHDIPFVFACLRAMLEENMVDAAYQAAGRLLEKEPAVFLDDPELFRQVFQKSGQLARFSKMLVSMPAPSEAGRADRIAAACEPLADLLAQRGDHEGALALWRRMEELAPGAPVPLERSQKRLISCYQLDRADEAAAEAKRLFLGKPRGIPGLLPEGRSPAEEIMETVSLREPCLVPPFTLSFHMAAHYGVALEIAARLEKSQGSREKKMAAKAVALALRLAAREPALVADVKKAGAAYASRLPREMPPAGLALIAFELQQFDAGRAAASSVIGRMLDQKADSFSATGLLFWKVRLADFQPAKKRDGKEMDRLVAQLLGPGESSSFAFGDAIRRLLAAGDLERAARLGEHYERLEPRSRRGSFRQEADAFGLIDLFQAKAAPMPMIWSASAGDELEVRWEFGVNQPAVLQPEIRVLGAPIPALDKRHTLEIYAFRGQHSGGALQEDARVAVLPEVASTGRWKGKIPPERRWLVAAFRDEDGKTYFSPSFPAPLGKNLLSPIRIDSVLEGQGDWSASKWFWGSPLEGAVPREAVFLSRLQPGVGTMLFKHRRVPVDPARDYVLSGWIKTDERGDARLGVAFFDAGGKQVGEWADSVTGGGAWTFLSRQFGASKGAGIKPLPPNASTAEVRLILDTQCGAGEIGWYDAPR